MMRCLVICFLLLTQRLAAQQDSFHLVAITGHVTNSGSGEPIPFVQVEVGGSAAGPSATDFDGFFVFRPNVSPGKYFVWFSANGYLPKAVLFEVYADEWTQRSVELDSLPR